jgi:hypothetical protein
MSCVRTDIDHIQGRERAVEELLRRTKGLEYISVSTLNTWKNAPIHYDGRNRENI